MLHSQNIKSQFQYRAFKILPNADMEKYFAVLADIFPVFYLIFWAFLDHYAHVCTLSPIAVFDFFRPCEL